MLSYRQYQGSFTGEESSLPDLEKAPSNLVFQVFLSDGNLMTYAVSYIADGGVRLFVYRNP